MFGQRRGLTALPNITASFRYQGVGNQVKMSINPHAKAMGTWINAPKYRAPWPPLTGAAYSQFGTVGYAGDAPPWGSGARLLRNPQTQRRGSFSRLVAKHDNSRDKANHYANRREKQKIAQP